MERAQYIYILRNPKNNEIFYVGCTINPKARALSHRHVSENIRYRGPKERYVSEHQIIPTMEVVQVVTDGLGLNREKKWIKRLRKKGHPLTNYWMQDETID